MIRKIINFVRDEEGNAAEYALIIGLIALVLVMGASAVGIAINNRLDAASKLF